MKNIDKVIKECIKKTLLEMDIVPLDKQGEVNLVRNQAFNAWRMIYSLMDNVKVAMDATLEGKKKYDHDGKYIASNPITNQDVDRIIDYIYDSIQGVIKNTIGGK